MERFQEGGTDGIAFVLDLSEQKRAEAEIKALKGQGPLFPNLCYS
jgi:hypothetical protein